VKPPLQIAYLTGQSDPRSCDLSAAQTRFLRDLPVPEPAKIYRNFPYRASMGTGRTIPIALASWNNVRQYLDAMTPGFATRYAPEIVALLERAERTVFLAGSCGIHLLRSLRLPRPVMDRIAVFAYGPVSFARPGCRHVIVGSVADPISRAFFPHPDVVVTAGHLSYLDDPALAVACHAFLDSLEADG
jgi:hypothetical protein